MAGGEKVRAVVAEAAGVVEAERVKLARFEAERAAAAAELGSLEERAGVEVLDDPDAAVRLPRVMGELRDRVEILARAIEAQAVRIVAAERAYLLAEAAVLEGPVRTARARLERHQGRTRELLAALEEHEGEYVPKVLLVQAEHELGGVVGQRSWVNPRSQVLEDELESLERPVLALREMVEGREPMLHPRLRECRPEDVFPACVWGPDALVKAPAYLRYAAGREVEAAVPEAAPVDVE